MNQLKDLPVWRNIVKDAMEILCVVLWESPIVIIQEETARNALAKSIFEFSTKHLDHIWIPEDGESYSSMDLLFTSGL